MSALLLIGFISIVREKITLAEWVVVFSLGITLLWPFQPFRYVLPLLPWILFYLLAGLRTVYGWLKRGAKVNRDSQSWPLAGTALGLILLVNLWNNATYIFSRTARRPAALAADVL
ncbi:MAG: hypothetical protein ACREEM_53490 [Blastocatellia bacterium]